MIFPKVQRVYKDKKLKCHLTRCRAARHNPVLWQNEEKRKTRIEKPVPCVAGGGQQAGLLQDPWRSAEQLSPPEGSAQAPPGCPVTTLPGNRQGWKVGLVLLLSWAGRSARTELSAHSGLQTPGKHARSPGSRPQPMPPHSIRLQVPLCPPDRGNCARPHNARMPLSHAPPGLALVSPWRTR